MSDREQIDKIKAELLPTVSSIEAAELGRLRYTARRERRQRMIQRRQAERQLKAEARQRGYGVAGFWGTLLGWLIPAAVQAIRELMAKLFQNLNDKLDEWDNKGE